jgi:hypothetical protein
MKLGRARIARHSARQGRDAMNQRIVLSGRSGFRVGGDLRRAMRALPHSE